MANTISPALLDTKTLTTALGAAGPLLAPLRGVCQAIEVKGLNPGKKMSFPVITSTAATLRNPANFEVGDATVVELEVTPTELSQPFHASAANIQGGLDINALARDSALTLAGTILADVVALAKIENFPNAIQAAEVGFGLTELNAACATVKSPQRVALLSAAAFGNLRPHLTWTGEAWTLPGFTGIYEVDFATAGPGVYGLVASRDAIAVGYDLPDVNPVKPRTQRVILPGVDIAVLACSWLAAGTRTAWGSYDVILGAGVARSGNAVLFKS